MGYVYLLGDWGQDKIYKIGVTRGKLEKRIKKLQTGNSNQIYLVSYFETDNPFLMEKVLHERYVGQKVLNEWFELSDEVVLNFKEECEGIEKMFQSLKVNPFFTKKLKKIIGYLLFIRI